MKIAIIGGGVNGLSSAVKIAENFYENPSVLVTLFSDVLTPNTTGDGSAGLWSPYLCGNTPVDKVRQWSKENYEFYIELWRNGLAGEVGLSMMPAIRVTNDPSGYTNPIWSDIPLGFTRLNEDELERLSKEYGQKFT